MAKSLARSSPRSRRRDKKSARAVAYFSAPPTPSIPSLPLLQTIFETVPIPLVLIDGDLRVLLANGVFFESFGLSKNDVIDRLFYTLSHGDWDVPGFREKLAALSERQEPINQWPIEFKHLGLPSKLLVVNAGALPTGGKRRLILIALRDRSEQKSAEDAMHQKDMQLHQAHKLEAIGRLAGGVAHDFNNLLTGMMGITQGIYDSMPIDDDRRLELREVTKAAERAFGLTKQLLAFGRRQVGSPARISLNSIVTDIHNLMQRLIGENIQLALDLERGETVVEVDRSHIEQIIANLVLNARDAMPYGGTIRIATSRREIVKSGSGRLDLKSGHYIVLAISDDGVGMSDDTLLHIFEPFFTTKGKDQGTGLGLATVYGLVKQAGGDVIVKSAPKAGTTFTIYLPRIDAPAATVQAISSEVKNNNGLETILLVEDEDIVRKVAATILRKKGYTVLAAANAKEAVALSEKHRDAIALMVTDLVMPGLNGRQLARVLAPKRPEMAVLYMSAYAEDVIARQGILDPGLAFLDKSVLSAQLADKVRELLDHSKSKSAR